MSESEEEYLKAKIKELNEEYKSVFGQDYYSFDLQGNDQNNVDTWSLSQHNEEDNQQHNEDGDIISNSSHQSIEQNREQRPRSNTLIQSQALSHDLENLQTTNITSKIYKSKHYDNKRTECVTLEMNKLLDILNQCIKDKDIKRELIQPNIGKQFRGSVKTHNNFINAKIYQILCYKKIANKNTIITMINEKKDEFFGYIVNCNFKYIHEIYTKDKNSNTIPLDEMKIKNGNALNYKGFDYEKCINEKIDKMKKEKKKSEEEIEEKQNDLMKYSKNLIEDITGSGKVRKLVSRPPRKNEETTIKYETIEEIEKFMKK